MRVDELEKYNTFTMGKWSIFNGDDTGREFRVTYCGHEIDNVSTFSMDVNSVKPITISITALVRPRSPATGQISELTSAFAIPRKG